MAALAAYVLVLVSLLIPIIFTVYFHNRYTRPLFRTMRQKYNSRFRRKRWSQERQYRRTESAEDGSLPLKKTLVGVHCAFCVISCVLTFVRRRWFLPGVSYCTISVEPRKEEGVFISYMFHIS